MVPVVEKRWYLWQKNCCEMVPAVEKSKMSLIFKRQKCPVNRQICPFGYFIKSIFLEVRIFSYKYKYYCHFPQTHFASKGNGHWQLFLLNQLFSNLLNQFFFIFCSSFFYLLNSLFYLKTFKTLLVSGAAYPIGQSPTNLYMHICI